MRVVSPARRRRGPWAVDDDDLALLRAAGVRRIFAGVAASRRWLSAAVGRAGCVQGLQTVVDLRQLLAGPDQDDEAARCSYPM